VSFGIIEHAAKLERESAESGGHLIGQQDTGFTS
jgi:hypothetical protein